MWAGILATNLRSGGQELVRNVLVEAAHPHEVVEQALAADHLEQVDDLLPLAEHVEERGEEGTALVDESADRDEVGGDALELGDDDPQVLRPLGDRNTGQLLDGQHVAQVVAHRRDVVQAVGERDDAGVGPLLGQLLDAPVQVAEDRLDVNHYLAIERDPDAEHAVACSGWNGPKLMTNGSVLSRHL